MGRLIDALGRGEIGLMYKVMKAGALGTNGFLWPWPEETMQTLGYFAWCLHLTQNWVNLCLLWATGLGCFLPKGWVEKGEYLACEFVTLLPTHFFESVTPVQYVRDAHVYSRRALLSSEPSTKIIICLQCSTKILYFRQKYHLLYPFNVHFKLVFLWGLNTVCTTQGNIKMSRRQKTVSETDRTVCSIME